MTTRAPTNDELSEVILAMKISAIGRDDGKNFVQALHNAARNFEAQKLPYGIVAQYLAAAIKDADAAILDEHLLSDAADQDDVKFAMRYSVFKKPATFWRLLARIDYRLNSEIEAWEAKCRQHDNAHEPADYDETILLVPADLFACYPSHGAKKAQQLFAARRENVRPASTSLSGSMWTKITRGTFEKIADYAAAAIVAGDDQLVIAAVLRSLCEANLSEAQSWNAAIQNLRREDCDIIRMLLRYNLHSLRAHDGNLTVTRAYLLLRLPADERKEWQ